MGTIEQCEEVAGSDKLLKLQVNFGTHGMRQIMSGVKKHFSPTDLLHKQAVFVFNLAPRKMMGFESQGMLLTAEGEGGALKIIAPAGAVANGSETEVGYSAMSGPSTRLSSRVPVFDRSSRACRGYEWLLTPQLRLFQACRLFESADFIVANECDISMLINAT